MLQKNKLFRVDSLLQLIRTDLAGSVLFFWLPVRPEFILSFETQQQKLI